MTSRVCALARRLSGAGRDSGQVTPFVVLLAVALLAVAGLVLDAGLAISAKVQALDTAQAAARAGAQQLDLYAYRTRGVTQLDTTRAASTARSWLASAGVDGDVSATATTVTVTVRRSSHTQLLQIVGVQTLNMSASATAAAVQGVTGPNT
ncbi:pilus assembly protein TadG-related protein [Salinispora cortesiana]|uniref:pilus assembly protein TadG-related protein n=1 Tax=Salinispora cortesiana TaxID=1305843 RepID=UPI0004136B8C|nr:pilus assembly protein TadG-related protein [Salinispora cortesiana]